MSVVNISPALNVDALAPNSVYCFRDIFVCMFLLSEILCQDILNVRHGVQIKMLHIELIFIINIIQDASRQRNRVRRCGVKTTLRRRPAKNSLSSVVFTNIQSLNKLDELHVRQEEGKKKENYVLFDQYFSQCIHYIHVKQVRTNTNIKITANMAILYNN